MVLQTLRFRTKADKMTPKLAANPNPTLEGGGKVTGTVELKGELHRYP